MDNETPYEEIGPTRALTSYAKPTQTSKPSAEVRRIIGELGLRYRPSAQTDLEAHAARIALLACDLATIPPHLLRRAVDRWVRESQYMPTAAELIRMAREELVGDPTFQPASIQKLQEHCDKLNAHHWVADSGCLYFVNKRDKVDGTSEHFVDRHI